MTKDMRFDMNLPKPFIVAEISGNHNGSKQRLWDLIDVASSCGADAVKFQCYTPDTITIDHDGPGFVIQEGNWKGKTLYQLYTESHTPWKWLPKAFGRARTRGLIPFASPFDHTAIDFLETLDCPIYKISSLEAGDIPLVQAAAQTGKPLIISDGIGLAHEAARMSGAEEVYILDCVADYPSQPCLRPGYDGLSDHSLSTTLPVAAIGMGGWIIEKHLTLHRQSERGNDTLFSMEGHEFKKMSYAIREAYEAMHRFKGKSPYSDFKRSLYAVKDITEGEKLTVWNVRSIRPGYGLEPEEIGNVLACTAKVDIKRGTPLSWELCS